MHSATALLDTKKKHTKDLRNTKQVDGWCWHSHQSKAENIGGAKRSHLADHRLVVGATFRAHQAASCSAVHSKEHAHHSHTESDVMWCVKHRTMGC